MLIQNAVQITENGQVTYLLSNHRHDFRQYDFEDGGFYFIDGGLDYLRKGGTSMGLDCIKDFSLNDDDKLETVAEKLIWGSYGKYGEHQLIQYKPLCECDTEHLKAILKTQSQIKGGLVETVINFVLEKRKQKT